MNRGTDLVGFAEFRRLKSISLWILGVKHKRILASIAIIRGFLSLLDLLFMYLITLYTTMLSGGLLQNNLLTEIDLAGSNSMLYLIVFVLIAKNSGSIALQKLALQSLAAREAEVGTFMVNAAAFENDDLSRQSNTSELFQTLSTTIAGLFNHLFKTFTAFVADFTTLLVISVGLFLFNWKLALVLLTYFGLLGFLLSRFIGQQQGIISGKIQSLGRSLYQMYAEIIELKTELKLSQKDSEFVQNIHVQRQEFTQLQSNSGFLTFLSRHILEIFLVFGIVIAVSFVEIFQKSESVLTVIALMVAAGFRTLPSLNSVIISMGSFRMSIPALNRIDGLGQRFGIRDIDLTYSAFKDDSITTPFKGDLIFESVTYGFPGAQRCIFEDFNLILNHKKTLLVKGVSGTGKTTLLSLATGILSPTYGKIVIRSNNLEMPVNRMVSGISFLKQNAPLLDESIGFNIAMRSVGEDDYVQLQSVAEKVGLLSRILNSPESFNARIGENGNLLSAGQRQRLGLARSLFSSPSFLVLDEPTANLDSESEQLIWKLLVELKGSMSILIVSHKDMPSEVFDDLLDLQPRR